MIKLKKSLDFIKKVIPPVIKITLLFVTLGLTVMFLGALIGWFEQSDRIRDNLDRYKAEVSDQFAGAAVKPVKIVDKKQKLIGEFYRKNFRPIRKDNLKDHANIVWALLSSEDREFFNHWGINYKALARAVYINFTSGRMSQGGSTITQQLAKLTMDLGKRSVFNKLTEAFCTYYIENRYDKETILAMYMNQIFMGEGNTGIEEASRYYFNKPATKLTPAEAAMLTAIIPAPSVHNPVKNLDIALSKQRIILGNMKSNKHLHFYQKNIEKDFDKKIDENIRIFHKTYNVKEAKSEGTKKKFVSEIAKQGYDRDFKLNLAPDFNDSIRRYVFERFTSQELEQKAITVYTTLDFDKQQIASAAVKEGVDKVRIALEKRRAEYLEKGKKDEAKREKEIIEGMNGALVSINPYTGYVEAMVGSYKISQVYKLNRAEEAKRQPGSTIKALVYALALEKKIISPSSIVLDEKLDFKGYSPKNWYSGFHGQMTARQALAQSVNTISVKLLHEVGVTHFLKKLALILNVPYSEIQERVGNNLSLALGSGELTPMELAVVYATLANGGNRVIPKKVLKIEDSIGNVLVDETGETEKISIIDPTAAAIAINMMEAVLSQEGTMFVKTSQSDSFPMAGKTGTVQTPKSALKRWGNRKGVRDSWFAGIFPGLATSVWIGNDQGAPFPGSGSGDSGQVWVKYALAIKRIYGFEEALIRPFEGDFVRVDICGETGELLSDFPDCNYPLLKQYYYKGYEPQKIEDQNTVNEITKELEFDVKERELGTDLEEGDPNAPVIENREVFPETYEYEGEGE
jgi:penicillin-binding protein 1A